MEFVVHVEGEPAELGHWVLAVDAPSQQFLITGEDGQFRWIAMGNCQFLRAANPDVPRPVMIVQPRQGIAVPQIQVGNGKH